MTTPRVLLDANVLFPTVLREILLGTAATGAFAPVWSARILEEWARATRRLGPGAEDIARGEIALLRANWPGAETAVPHDIIRSIVLPDADDAHVLAAAVAGGAGTLLTRNRRDFPARALARHGVVPRDPDRFLLELAEEGGRVADAVHAAHARAEAVSGHPIEIRPFLRRAGLNLLGKWLAADADRPVRPPTPPS